MYMYCIYIYEYISNTHAITLSRTLTIALSLSDHNSLFLRVRQPAEKEAADQETLSLSLSLSRSLLPPLSSLSKHGSLSLSLIMTGSLFGLDSLSARVTASGKRGSRVRGAEDDSSALAVPPTFNPQPSTLNPSP